MRVAGLFFCKGRFLAETPQDPTPIQSGGWPSGRLPKAATGAESDLTLDTFAVKKNYPPMVTTVNEKNTVTIPSEVGRKLGIRPGWRLDWQPVEGRDEILVRVIPDRGEMARRLIGAGRRFSPDRDSVAELVAERAAEG